MNVRVRTNATKAAARRDKPERVWASAIEKHFEKRVT
jgi:hypothetical protein